MKKEHRNKCILHLIGIGTPVLLLVLDNMEPLIQTVKMKDEVPRHTNKLPKGN